MGLVDDNMELSSDLEPDPLTQKYSKPVFDIDERHPVDRQYPIRTYYRGQLQHRENSYKDMDKTYYNILQNSMNESTTWFNRSKENVEFLNKHLDNIVKDFCSTYYIAKMISEKVDDEVRISEDIHAAVDYLFYHTRYGRGERFLDYCDMNDLRTMEQQFEKYAKRAYNEYRILIEG